MKPLTFACDLEDYQGAAIYAGDAAKLTRIVKMPTGVYFSVRGTYMSRDTDEMEEFHLTNLSADRFCFFDLRFEK